MRLAQHLGINRAVLALSVARLADALGNSILYVVIPLYAGKLPAPWLPFSPAILIGLLLSEYGFVVAGLQPFTGALSDRLGRRKLFIQAGLLLMAAGTLGFVFAHRFVVLLALRAVQGVGVALTVPAAMALMAAATKKESRGSAMGFYTTTRMVGFAGGPLIGGFLQVHFGFDVVFYTAAACLSVGILLVQLWVHDPGRRAPREQAARRPLFDRRLFSAGIPGLSLATFLMAGDSSLMATLENQFNRRLDQSALGFGLAYSALMVSRLLLQVPLGWLSDRIGRRPLIAAGLLVMAPGTALLGAAGSTLQLAGYRALQGLGAAGIAAPAFALGADMARAGGEGTEMSLITMGFGLGIAVGPLAAGFLSRWFFELPFLVGGALSLAGAWVVQRYVPETIQRAGAPAGETPVES